MERDPAKLSRLLGHVLLAVALLTVVALAAACSEDDGDRADDADAGGSATTVTTRADEPDVDAFCVQLADVLEADPFDDLFGNENPMQAAAVFDGGETRLDALVAVAPDDIAPAAEQYRDAFVGWRDLILPTATIDEAGYRAAADELRADEDAARADLDAHLAADCAPR